MSDPTQQEIDHGVKLLREAHQDSPWDGKVAFVPIDFECRWGYPEQICGASLQEVVILRYKEGDGVHVLALCAHHTACMEAAVKKWREMA